MNGRLVLTDSGLEIPAFGPARRTASERLVLKLVLLGIMASLVVGITYHQALTSQAKPDETIQIKPIDSPDTIVKPRLYYVAHAIQLTLLLLAGLIALLSTDFRTIERGYPLKFALLLGAALLMTARGYTFSDLLSTKLADQNGPIPFFMSLLVFVGARRNNWLLLSKLIGIMAVVFSALALLGMAGLSTFTRQEVVLSLGGTLNVLYWPASWIVLNHYPQPSLGRRLRFIPILIYSLGSFFTQTRLNFVMIFSLLAVYTFLRRKRKMPQAPVWIIGLTLTLWAGLFTSVFLRNTRAFDRIESVAAAFNSRLDEDTRTGQLISFAENVDPHELVLGKGSFGTWNWDGMLWGGADLGYLSLLFYGGVPLLLTYLATHLLPCFKVLRNHPADLQLTAAGLVLLWGVIMFSSAYPDLDLGYYTILFCVGACISTDFSDRDRRVPA